jgi:transposase IS66 family protein
VLRADFDGFLVRDGWSIYRQFIRATHQSCLAHLLRRCREMILGCRAGGRGRFPAVCKPFCSKLCNCGTVASKLRSASGEWPLLADDWKPVWTACSSVAGVRPKTAGWQIICYESARLCSPSSTVLVLERGLCVIERRARNAEGERRFHDRSTFDAMPT